MKSEYSDFHTYVCACVCVCVVCLHIFIICCCIMNSHDASPCLGRVCFLFPESKLNCRSSVQNKSSFKSRLKTFLFAAAFNSVKFEAFDIYHTLPCNFYSPLSYSSLIVLKYLYFIFSKFEL